MVIRRATIVGHVQQIVLFALDRNCAIRYGFDRGFESRSGEARRITTSSSSVIMAEYGDQLMVGRLSKFDQMMPVQATGLFVLVCEDGRVQVKGMIQKNLRRITLNEMRTRDFGTSMVRRYVKR